MYMWDPYIHHTSNFTSLSISFLRWAQALPLAWTSEAAVVPREGGAVRPRSPSAADSLSDLPSSPSAAGPSPPLVTTEEGIKAVPPSSGVIAAGSVACLFPVRKRCKCGHTSVDTSPY